MQACYARALSEAGHWDEALSAWKEAGRLYRNLGARSLQIGASGSIRLNELESRLARFGPNDASVKRIEHARKRIRYDYWLTRYEFEQDAEVQAARRLAWEAEQHAKQSEPDRAYDFYRQSLQVLSDLRERRPAQVSLFATEFRHVAEGYREAAEQLGKMDGQSLDSILTMIEESQPLSPFPLLDLQQAGEADGILSQ
jgi:hypothetical protein